MPFDLVEKFLDTSRFAPLRKKPVKASDVFQLKQTLTLNPQGKLYPGENAEVINVRPEFGAVMVRLLNKPDVGPIPLHYAHQAHSALLPGELQPACPQ